MTLHGPQSRGSCLNWDAWSKHSQPWRLSISFIHCSLCRLETRRNCTPNISDLCIELLLKEKDTQLIGPEEYSIFHAISNLTCFQLAFNFGNFDKKSPALPYWKFGWVASVRALQGVVHCRKAAISKWIRQNWHRPKDPLVNSCWNVHAHNGNFCLRQKSMNTCQLRLF